MVARMRSGCWIRSGKTISMTPQNGWVGGFGSTHELWIANVQTSSMECFIVLPLDVDRTHRELILRDEEAHHALRSLRLRPGDELLTTDLIGTCYLSRLKESSGDTVTCEIEGELPNFGEPARDVLLIASPLSQPARWESLLEKATELGANAIQPILTERTERWQLRRERSEKILRAAVKQTKRARMPILNDPNGLHDALAKARAEKRTIIFLHESAPVADSLGQAVAESKNALALAVGPEGGFSGAEVELARGQFGARIVSLGPRRLRSETAALAALAIVMA